jgi:membrane protease YdiL (CAAX protease family)
MPRVLTDVRTERPSGASGADGVARGARGPLDARAESSLTAAQALGLAALIVLAEYLARRILAPTMPSIGAPPVNSDSLPVGAPVVNDMVAAALIYVLLVTLVAVRHGRPTAALGAALRGIAVQARTWLPWAGGVLFLVAVVVVMPLDARLWGDVRLPSFTVPPSTTVLFAGAATPLAIMSLLIVNGVVIPLAEERLWRGLIQPGLRVAWGVIPALLVTAVLFSLKHAIVDASLGRLLALTVGGLVLGLVAYRAGRSDGGRSGWEASAVSHMVGNLVATSLALAAGAI